MTIKDRALVITARLLDGDIADVEEQIAAAVEEEREECAKIIEDSYDSFTDTALPFAGPALLRAAKDIRARSNKPDGGTK